MAIVSDNLIHFLARAHKDNPNNQFDICKLIIENGLRVSQYITKFPDGSYVSNHAVCFTDIPLKECNEHTSVYGKFGIGFKKSFIKNAGGNPARYFVDYVPGQQSTTGIKSESRGAFFLNLWHQFQQINKLNNLLNDNPNMDLYDDNHNIIINRHDLRTLIDSMVYTFSFDKEMGDLGIARDETKEIDLYYKEREWRLVPSALNEASGSIVLNQTDNCFYYPFEREHVNMFVVPNEGIRKNLLDYFQSIQSNADNHLIRFKENLPPIINYDDLQFW